MSTPVALSDLAQTISRFQFAYLLTTGDDARCHVLAVTPEVEGASLTVRGLGRRTAHNLAVRPDVTLLWPPGAVDEYSLIVDGRAAIEGTSAIVEPTRAVLHRPAPRPEPDAADDCKSDCIELPLPGSG